MHRILPLDGGGLMGIGPITLLKELSDDIGNINSFFDAYAGTSTGSIIAGCFAIGLTAKEIHTLYRAIGKTVFSNRNFLPHKPKYNNKPLKKALKDIFGDITMGELEKPLYIAVSDFTLKRTRIISRDHEDWKLWKVILMSCSAPTFFEPVDDRFYDGGLTLQNPSFAAAQGYSEEIKVPLGDISVLSMGTNGHSDIPIPLKKNMFLWDILVKILKFMFESSEGISDHYCKKADLHSYMRLEPSISKEYKMDDYKMMDEYSRVWSLFYKEKRESLLKFLTV